MDSRLQRVVAFIVAFGATAAAAPCALAQAPQASAGLRWLCGGVGADARRELAAMHFGENLVLTFVSAKRGGYQAGAKVALYDAGAATPRLSLVADGPICLLSAPPGTYRIEALLDGVKRSATARLAAGAGRTQRLVFAFPEGPWDGISADEEEKRQAREP